MIKEPILIIICIILSCVCYTNYQGWERCYQNKERIADDLYKMQKEAIVKNSEHFRTKLDLRCCEVKIAELEAKFKETRYKK